MKRLVLNSINLTLIAGMILIFIGMVAGFKVGMAKGLSHLMALIATVLTLVLVLMIYTSFHHHLALKRGIVSLIMLIVLGAVYGVVKIVCKSLTKISELPILHQLNSILGIPTGLIWIAILMLVIIALAYRNMLGGVGPYIVFDIESSPFLKMICSYVPFVIKV